MAREKMTENQSPFREVAVDLNSNGYSILPIRYREKRPVVSEWSKYCRESPEKADLNSWWRVPQLNIGIALGPKSGIVAVDFDNNIDYLHEKIISVMGDYLVAKKGEKGFTAFFRYNGEAPKKWQKDGEMIVELLSDGNQTVLPPSIHPCGDRYTYITDRTLSNTKANELPYLPTNFVEEVERIFRGEPKELALDSEDVNVEELKEALTFIEPDNYEIWLKVGMAIKESLGEDGLKIWDDWSTGSEKYSPDNILQKWNSFKRSGITVGTILHFAIANGFKLDREEEPQDDLVNLDDVFDTIENWRVHGRPIGVNSGIPAMDKLLRIRRKEFTVVTGYENAGKSEFMDYLCYQLMIEQDYKVLFISPEKDTAFHVDSFIHRCTGKSLEKRTAAEQKKGMDFVRRHLMFRDYLKYGTDITNILKSASKHKMELGYDIIVIDPFNKITCKESGDNLYFKVQSICNKCSAFCKSHDIHMFLVAHPRTQKEKNTDGSRVKLNSHSLAGGADFANMAENLMVITRGEMGTEVDIQKVRYQELDSPGMFILKYNKETRLFEEGHVANDF